MSAKSYPYPEQTIKDPLKILDTHTSKFNALLTRQMVFAIIITSLIAILIGAIYFVGTFAVDAVISDIQENNQQISRVSDKIDKVFLKLDSIENEQIRLSTVVTFMENNIPSSESEK